jgi:outer membrane immunogenic protein
MKNNLEDLPKLSHPLWTAPEVVFTVHAGIFSAVCGIDNVRRCRLLVGVTMRRFQCAMLATVAVFGFASVASADGTDRARRAAAPVAVAAPSWTGFYAGINAGGAWGKSDYSLTPSGAVPTRFGDPSLLGGIGASGTGSFKRSGFTGGGQFGFNYQAGSWVYGFETDLNYLGLNSSASAAVPLVFSDGTPVVSPNGAPIAAVTNTSLQADAFVTARLRLGFTANNWLFYGTGGFAGVHVKAAQDWSFTNFGPFTTLSGQTNNWRPGWAYGGGVEWMFNPKWTVKAEYLHVRTRDETFFLINPNANANTSLHTDSFKMDVARLGLNYKF